MLWFILTLMTCVAALWLAAPFMQAAPASDVGHNADANVYRDQLAEVDREQRDGLISPEQADAARLEIKRRLLALDRSALPALRRLSPIERTFLGRGLALAGAVTAMSLYMVNGNPDIPSQPRTTTTAAGPAVSVAPSAAISGGQVAAPADGAPALAGVDEMIEKLAARLAKSPNDADGWRMLGWSYSGTERFVEAAQAYAKAIELTPKIATLRTSHGEALVRAADGQVTPAAAKAFDEAIKLDAKELRARFFLGLAKEQAGQKAAALKDWVAVLSDAGPTDDWVPDLKERAQALAQELGQDVSAVVGQPAAAAVAAPATGGVLAKLNAAAKADQGSAPRGPTPSDIKAAEALPASDRNAMIQGMVDSLQKRLDASPRDAEGWTKLIRSRMVLGEAAKAKTALDRALKTFADSPAELKLITDTAAELGMKR
jgi:cytochrome c-type biogenesis protein CcmH